MQTTNGQLEVIQHSLGYGQHKAILTLPNGEKHSKLIFDKEYDAIFQNDDDGAADIAAQELSDKIIKEVV